MVRQNRRIAKESRKAGRDSLFCFLAFLLSLFISLGPNMTGVMAAQNAPGPQDQQDPLGPPTQRGIRFTPAMARAVSHMFTRNVLVPHYELDPAKTDEAAELLAHRLMSTAHTLDANGAEFAEALVTRIFEF